MRRLLAATLGAPPPPPSCRFHKPFQKSGAQTDMEERRDAIEVVEAVAASSSAPSQASKLELDGLSFSYGNLMALRQ